MPKPRSAVSCVESGTPPQRRLGGAEAVVIIVIITMAGALVTFVGMTLPVVLQLLLGAGLIAVLLVALVTGTTTRGLRAALRALLALAA
ncbi:hypothetical protein [Streptomyces sp. CMSTAAHL-2]|uniref:hypothetical protein n=1 Tax=Streptomyces sp. CMSTAAHL-2 TaxID=2904522 RepID=UPI001E287AB5|nr:hypothetical protein [Streptomyces sp. CMSTAAHL-2]MCE3030803.1 hypothetical protein [Streptomyces sp. CMSTAAHL-2]